MITNEQIASILGKNLSDVNSNWPIIYNNLVASGESSNASIIATLSTVGVECSHFRPETETGKNWKRYEGSTVLGNTQAGDGYTFRGRGYQLTGRWNYEHFGKILGLDLIKNPDLVNDPDTAAKILVTFMKERGCYSAAAAGDWKSVRIKYNGGLTNYDKFCYYISELQKILK